MATNGAKWCSLEMSGELPTYKFFNGLNYYKSKCGKPMYQSTAFFDDLKTPTFKNCMTSLFL